MGPFEPGNIRFRASRPVSQAVAVLGGTPYSYFRYEMHLAALNGLPVYDEIAAEFARTFGRSHDAVEAYRNRRRGIRLLHAGLLCHQGEGSGGPA